MEQPAEPQPENRITIDGSHNIVIQNVSGSSIFINSKGESLEIPRELTYVPQIVVERELVGRAKELKELETALENGGKVVLYGMGGVGKTTLAKAYVDQHLKQFQHVVWATETDSAIAAFTENIRLIENLRKLELEIGAYGQEPEPRQRKVGIEQDTENRTRLFRMIMQVLAGLPGENLLIVDNALKDVEEAAFKEWLPGRNWQVLMTSREQLEEYTLLHLGVLEPAEAQALFQLHCQQVPDPENIEALLEEVGHHALTIELIAKTLRKKRGRMTVGEMLDHLRKHELDIEDLKKNISGVRHAEGQQLKLYSHLLRTFSLAELEGEELQLWALQQFVALPAYEFSFKELFELLNPPKDKKNALEEAINHLVVKGWLRENQATYAVAIHRMVQEVVQYQHPVTEQAIKGLMNQVIHFFSDEQALSPAELIVYVPYVRRLLTVIPDQTTDYAARLQFEAANAEKEVGNIRIAIPLYESAVQAMIRLHGENSKVVLGVQRELAGQYATIGEFEKAGVLLEQLLERASEFDGPGNVVYESIKASYGELLTKLGEYEKAEQWLTESLDYYQSKFGLHSTKVSTAQFDLGLFYEHLGRFEKAVDFLEQALESWTSLDGLDEIWKAGVHRALGRNYKNLGLYDKALAALQPAILTYEAYYGSEHPVIGGVKQDLADVFKAKGEYEKARVLLEAALELELKYYGANHPGICMLQSNLGSLYRHLNEHTKAEWYLKAAVDTSLQLYGSEHPFVAAYQHSLAVAYMDQRLFQEARSYLEQALETNKRCFGPGSPRINVSQADLGWIYFELGDLDKAIELVELSNVSNLTHYGDKHPDTSNTQKKLGFIYRKAGQYAKAISAFEACIAADISVLGAEHPAVEDTRFTLGQTLCQMEDYEEAALHLAWSLDYVTTHFGPQGRKLSNRQVALARVYKALGRFGEAEALIKAALHLSEQHFGTQHSEYAICQSDLGLLYRKMGRYQEALPLLISANAIDESRNDPRLYISLWNLALGYQDIGNYEMGFRLMTRVHDILQDKFGDEDIKTAEVKEELGWMHRDLKAPLEGIPLLKAAIQILNKHHGKNHQRLDVPCMKLGMLYREAGKLKQARKLAEAAYKNAAERQYGQADITLSGMQYYLALLYSELKKDAKALHLFEAALTHESAILGDRHPYIGYYKRDLGKLLYRQGKQEEGLRNLLEAREILEASLGPEHPKFVALVAEMGPLISNSATGNLPV